MPPLFVPEVRTDWGTDNRRLLLSCYLASSYYSGRSTVAETTSAQMTDLRLNFLSLEVLQGIYLQTRESNSNLQDRITQLCGGKWSCWKASSSKESQPPRDWWCWLPPVKSAAWSNCTTAYTSSKGKNASFEPCADNTALRANKACSTKGWKC